MCGVSRKTGRVKIYSLMVLDFKDAGEITADTKDEHASEEVEFILLAD
jgi:hypothetical protein